MTDANTNPPLVIWGTRRKIDERGRVSLSPAVLDAVGLEAGAWVQIYVLNGEARIQKASA